MHGFNMHPPLHNSTYAAGVSLRRGEASLPGNCLRRQVGGGLGGPGKGGLSDRPVVDEALDVEVNPRRDRRRREMEICQYATSK